MTSYAATVRAVLPSVVLIRTADGLGSGVVLGRAGHPGNSGGALVDPTGQVIGIPTLAAAHPGQQVEATITRAGQARTATVTLGTLPGT